MFHEKPASDEKARAVAGPGITRNTRPVFFLIAAVCSLAILVVMLVSAGCTSAPANLTATEVADRYVHQQESLRDLSETVEITRDYFPHTDRFHLQKKNPHQYRLEYLVSGSETNGTLIQTNGSVIWWYSPLMRSVQTTMYFDPDETYLTDRDYQALISNLFVKYPHSYSLNSTDRGNNSYVMVFSQSSGESGAGLPEEFRDTRVWIDAGSWMAKKIVIHNIAWHSTLTIEYQNIRTNNDLPDSRFVYDPRNIPNPPEEFRDHPPAFPFFSLKEAYLDSGFDLVVPAYVPEGYSYGDGSETWDGARIFWLLNGSQSICYIDSPVIGKPYTEPFEGETLEVAINRTVGQFRKGTDKNQLVWIRSGHTYSLTGMVDFNEMVRMAKSLVHVNDRLMQTLPQKEPETAKPMTVSELTSIIMPESWIRDHNNSTTTGIIDIRLPAREFDASFSKSPKYPDFLVYRNTSASERVALYQIPKTMFALNNRDPQLVVLNHPESMFHFYPDLNAVFEDRCKYDNIPCPSGGTGLHA